MKKIKLSSCTNSNHTIISNDFIDNYMPGADGSFVKVYIYLLMCVQSGSDISVSDIADALETSEKDILRAICYWERNSLISITRDNDNIITSIVIGSAARDDDTPLQAEASNVIKMPDTECVKDSVVLMEKLLEDATFSNMIVLIEKVLERPLSANLSALASNLYANYHFPSDLIVHLFEYCCSNNKGNDRYIEKVGMDWAKNGITTIKEANIHSVVYKDIYYDVINIFGISNRRLGTDEKSYLNKWVDEYKFSDDIIKEACSRTMKKIHTPSFQYTDTIITKWHDAGVTSKDDIDRLDELHEKEQGQNNNTTYSAKNPAGRTFVHNFNFEQRSYSDEEYASIEKRALARYLK